MKGNENLRKPENQKKNGKLEKSIVGLRGLANFRSWRQNGFTEAHRL